MKKIFIITLFSLSINVLFADGPIIEIIEPTETMEHISWDEEEIGPSFHLEKNDYINATSDVFQGFQLFIHDSVGIDWSSFMFEIVAYGGCISYNTGPTYWWTLGGPPELPDSVYDLLCWASEQDFSISIDTLSDTSGIITIIPEGRGSRPDFVCSDSCHFPGTYEGPCCINPGDINSPGFGHYVAYLWDLPSIAHFMIRNLAGEWEQEGEPLIVDYSGPSASHPEPVPYTHIDTTSPIISVVILDTVWIRQTAYPNPWEPWFPHCICEDTLCVDTLGEPLEFPYCGTKYIEWAPINEQSIIISVNSIEYTMESSGMHWVDDSLLVFNTGEAGLSFSEGETVYVCLEEATDMVSQGYGPNHLGRHLDWTHPDTPVPFCWEFYIGDVGIGERNETPQKFAIKSIEPNPFNSIVSIDYSIGEKTYIDISIYDVLGQKVKTLVNKKQNTGNYKVNWDATDNIGNSVKSGIYFVNVRTGIGNRVRRIVLVK